MVTDKVPATWQILKKSTTGGRFFLNFAMTDDVRSPISRAHQVAQLPERCAARSEADCCTSRFYV